MRTVRLTTEVILEHAAGPVLALSYSAVGGRARVLAQGEIQSHRIVPKVLSLSDTFPRVAFGKDEEEDSDPKEEGDAPEGEEPEPEEGEEKEDTETSEEESAPEDEEEEDSSVAVALLSIDGPIGQRRVDTGCGVLEGYDGISSRFVAALSDVAARGVVLKIDSPGGDSAGLEEAISAMLAAKAQHGKKVYAYADELIASGAYWLAAMVADKIYIPRSGGVGSIGCISMFADETGALEKEGVRVTVMRDPPGKAEAHPAAPVSELAEERIGSLVRQVSARFAAAVSAARGIGQADIRALNGAVLFGDAAVSAGLVDGIASLADVVAMAAKEAEEEDVKEKEELAVAVGLPKNAKASVVAEKLREATQVHAAVRTMVKLTGASNADEALGVVSAWKASHTQAIVDRKIQAAATAEREAVELKEILAKAVAEGFEIPATAWEDPTVSEGSLKPSEFYATQPIASVRTRFATLAESGVRPTQAPPRARASVALSERELRMCAELKLDPATYAATKAAEGKRI